MNDLERFLACMEYQPVDHIPFWNWGAWPETIERWKAEGYDPLVYEPGFLADDRHWIGHWFFPNPPFEHTILEENERHIVYVNHEGIVMKEMKDQPFSSMPQFLKFPVENRQEFRQFWQERMVPDLTQRIGPDWPAHLRELRAQPMPLVIISDRWGGFFGPLRSPPPSPVNAHPARPESQGSTSRKRRSDHLTARISLETGYSTYPIGR